MSTSGRLVFLVSSVAFQPLWVTCRLAPVLKTIFINVPYHILGAGLTNGSVLWLLSLKQFFVNVSYHILVASLTLMALFKVLLLWIFFVVVVVFCLSFPSVMSVYCSLMVAC